MFEYPNKLTGPAEEQLAYLRKYLFTVIEELNKLQLKVNELEEIIAEGSG